MRRRVLIVCTGNSCRSQMAEGMWRTLGAPAWEAHSAGSAPAGFVHPLAIRVMGEIGIDLASHRSKSIEEACGGGAFDLVITVCDGARGACPTIPGARAVLHWPFEDPAGVAGSEEARLAAFRSVRDAIRARIEAYLAAGDRGRP